jgi:hypothetical protein
MNRGNRGENIYCDDVNRQDLLKTPAETCQKTGFEVHAYCLLRNHFHSVVVTPNANLVPGMKWHAQIVCGRAGRRATWRGHPKGDPVQLALATRLRRETTLSHRWIADRLLLGAWKSANTRLHRWCQANPAR